MSWRNCRTTSAPRPKVLKLRCRIYRQADKWDYLSTLAKDFYAASAQEQFLIDWAWAEYKQGREEPARVLAVEPYDLREDIGETKNPLPAPGAGEGTGCE